MKVLNRISCLTLGSVLFFSCNNASQNGVASSDSTAVASGQQDQLPLLTNPTAEKLRYFFNITGVETTDSVSIYTCESQYENQSVGFKIAVKNDMPAGVNAQGKPDEVNGFIDGGIKFIPTGASSDNFVKILSELTGDASQSKMTSDTVSALVFSSNNGPVDLTKNATYSFKLFLPNAVGAEAEAFAVLDTYRNSFELSEKDSTYRAQLISAFAGR